MSAKRKGTPPRTPPKRKEPSHARVSLTSICCTIILKIKEPTVLIGEIASPQPDRNPMVTRARFHHDYFFFFCCRQLHTCCEIITCAPRCDLSRVLCGTTPHISLSCITTMVSFFVVILYQRCQWCLGWGDRGWGKNTVMRCLVEDGAEAWPSRCTSCGGLFYISCYRKPPVNKEYQKCVDVYSNKVPRGG